MTARDSRDAAREAVRHAGEAPEEVRTRARAHGDEPEEVEALGEPFPTPAECGATDLFMCTLCGECVTEGKLSNRYYMLPVCLNCEEKRGNQEED